MNNARDGTTFGSWLGVLALALVWPRARARRPWSRSASFDRPGLRHLRAQRLRPPARGRAGRDGSSSPDGGVVHHRTSRSEDLVAVGCERGPALGRAGTGLRDQRAALRLLHRTTDGRPADRRVHAPRPARCRSRPAAPVLTIEHPTERQPQRRPASVRPRRLPLHRAPATGAASATRPATPRTWTRCSARSCGSTRSGDRHRPYTIPAGNPFVGGRRAPTRSGATGCATPGASRSTG